VACHSSNIGTRTSSTNSFISSMDIVSIVSYLPLQSVIMDESRGVPSVNTIFFVGRKDSLGWLLISGGKGLITTESISYLLNITESLNGVLTSGIGYGPLNLSISFMNSDMY